MKIRSPYAVLALLALALAIAACGDSAGPSGGGCDGPVTMTISSGSQPTFDWSPACTIAQVVVTDFDETDPDSVVKWQVLAEQNVIRPPVAYGVTPSNAVQGVEPRLLKAGRHYFVGLSVIDQLTGELVVQVQQQFVP